MHRYPDEIFTVAVRVSHAKVLRRQTAADAERDERIELAWQEIARNRAESAQHAGISEADTIAFEQGHAAYQRPKGLDVPPSKARSHLRLVHSVDSVEQPQAH